jgi:uncharacterized membrane protein HdeD (DUF308 family)
VQGKWEPNGQWRIDAPSRLSPHQKFESYFSVELSSWRRWYLWQGACLFLLGLVCLWVASGWPIAPVVPIETLLILGGAVTLVSALRAGQSPSLPLTLALIPLAAGAYLLGTPAPNLDLGLAGYFSASAVAIMLLAAQHRRRLFRQWEWLAVSGVTSLIFAILILSGLPGPFTWMFGVLIGVDFMFRGSAFMALALAADEI